MAQLMPNDTALLQRVETLVYQALNTGARSTTSPAMAVCTSSNGVRIGRPRRSP
jgi:hypothetical protein